MHDLVADMPIERLTVLYTALPDGARGALAGTLATVLHARPHKVPHLPVAMQVKALRACLKRSRSDDLAQELLGAYFLGPRKELVTAFLDATGVAHEQGQVEEDAKPDAGKVPAAVEALLAAHARDDVLLYLRVAKQQWPDNAAIAQQCEALGA